MARNQIFRRQRRLDGWKATTDSREAAADAAAQSPNQQGSKMLPRLLLCMGVLCSIVAISVLLVIQRATPVPLRPRSRNEASEKETVSRRAATDPMVHILGKYPHDAKAFTQGFTIFNSGHDRFFLESTGLYGESTMRYVDIETGKVLKQYELSKEHFGEGLTLGPKDEVVMLTWKSKTGLLFDLGVSEHGKADTITVLHEFKFNTTTGEGWGITFDGKNYVVSDGSSIISFWDPATMKEVRHIDVMISDGAQKVPYINELEFANGFIYANVWYQPYILKIDPDTGAVITMFDMSDLIVDAGVNVAAGAVLNGIAYDKAEDVFYITGKLWKVVYKIHLIDLV